MDSGFTAVEIIVGSLVMLVILSGAKRIFFSGVQEVQRGQESSEHIRGASLLFRELADDFSEMFPWGFGPGKPALRFDPPSSRKATAMTFWKILSTEGGESLRKVSYHFVPPPSQGSSNGQAFGEIIREEFDSDGTRSLKKRSICVNMVEDFSIEDLNGNSEKVLVRIELRGQFERKAGFSRFFGSGSSLVASQARFWNFRF